MQVEQTIYASYPEEDRRQFEEEVEYHERLATSIPVDEKAIEARVWVERHG